MRNIKLTIQYEGTKYNGWQIQNTQDIHQKNVITIQGIMKKTIEKITGEDANIIAAGRTDAGVHALAQIASFRTSSGLSPEVLKKALNANLPGDIRVIDVSDTAADFHPRYDTTAKTYFYVICNMQIVSPFLYRYTWRLPHQLDFHAMKDAAALLTGRHDFSSFRASGCGAKHPVRTISDISLESMGSIDFMSAALKGNFLKISIEADAFLRHMVRNIVGTLAEVGKGKLAPNDVQNILASKDRRLAGPTAPAQGLFLERVDYPSTFPILSSNSFFS